MCLLLPQQTGLAPSRRAGPGSVGRQLKPKLGERASHRHRPFLLDGIGDGPQQGDERLGRTRLDDDSFTVTRRMRLPRLDDVRSPLCTVAVPLLEQTAVLIDADEELGDPLRGGRDCLSHTFIEAL